MDADSSSKFIGSLTKFLQSLCNGYVEFQRGVELVGHIYLSIDTGEKVDYVLHEKVSKSDESSVTFVSNSFHALPPDKLDKNKSKDTSKQGNANINNAVIGAKGAGNSSDDDDLVIIESGSKDILGSTNSGTIPSRKRKASPSSDHHIQKVVKPLAGKSAVGQGVATNTRQQTGGPSATVSSQEGLNVGDMKLEQITSDELLSLASQVGEGHSRTSMPRSQGHRSGGSGDASGWIKQEALEDGDSDTGWSQGRDESNSNSGSNLYPVMLHQNTSAYSNPVFPGFSPHTGAPSSFANPVPGTSQDLGGIDASAWPRALSYQDLYRQRYRFYAHMGQLQPSLERRVPSSPSFKPAFLPSSSAAVSNASACTREESVRADYPVNESAVTSVSKSAISMRKYRERLKYNPELRSQYRARQMAHQKRYIMRKKIRMTSLMGVGFGPQTNELHQHLDSL